MLFMIIERFKDAAAVYRRYHQLGRIFPDGVTYLDSWVDDNLTRCFQLMEASDLNLLKQWTSNWNDLVEFEIVSVIKSAEAARKIS
jgi:hypothetical protein